LTSIAGRKTDEKIAEYSVLDTRNLVFRATFQHLFLLLKDGRIKYKELRANCLAAAKHYDRKVFAGNMLAILEKI
jgi:hypothetical protein